MNGALQKKLRSYLEARKVLQAHYLRVRESAEDLESRENIEALFEFDQLCYSYHAIKSYHDISKSEWTFTDRQPFDLFVDLMPKVEDKLYIPELCARYKGLQVLRRELYESAREGGRIAHMIMSSSGKPEDFCSKVDEILATLDSLPVPDTMGNSLKAWSPSASRKLKKKQGKSSEAIEISDGSLSADHMDTTGKQSGQQKHTKGDQSAQHLFSSSKAIHETPSIVTKSPAGDKSLSADRQSTVSVEVISDKPVPFQSSMYTTGSIQPVSKSDEASNANANDKDLKNTPEPTPSSSLPPTNSQRRTSSGPEDADSPMRKKNKPLPYAESGKSVTQEKSQTSTTDSQEHQSQQPSTINVPTERQTPIQPSKHPKLSVTNKPLTTALLDPKSQKASDTTIKLDLISLKHVDQNTEFIRGRASSLPIHSMNKTTRESNSIDYSNASKAANMLESSKKSPLTLIESSFAQFPTWTKDFVRCIVSAAACHPDKPAEAIQAALEKKCKIRVRRDEAEMLRLHYGLRPETMEKFEYYIQAFHLIASQFSEQRARYVTVPWAELRVQFTRATQFPLEDWDIRGRYHFFLLHRRVYGKQGEPSHNYRDDVDAFRKKYAYRKSSAFLKGKKNSSEVSPAKASPTTSLTFENTPKTFSMSPKKNLRWSPEIFQALVDGYCAIPRETPNRLLVLTQYVFLKTETRVEQLLLLDISKSKEFLKEIQKRLPEESESSISQIDPSIFDQYNKTLSTIIAHTHPDSFYSAIIKDHHLTDFWDFSKTKSIMSTVEYASKIDANTKIPSLRVIRSKVLLYIRGRLLREHLVNVKEETVSRRLVRMMELDMFDESQCLLLNEVLHKN
ncbi:hypothetical protein METBIDRAFT_30027 [Metschnikowia bicuspidata var. bicuspidata NRRL YB-4993]|uniref:Uncharacterized protein n=1 Tax=Metschnikowia bicuspidata var. bicuspidata NRRL YB-4993 TaxID=869754 RepID=A0A1A0HHV9_9ASCO|nr:hypothetical protein METBIDRAFT_30027 [Metschnikowia bicuspidata var. bicuspidata NRRL YB-4993]OBA23595.1 hypothetical protein METBIDRAFT_30027 [Metschnikowia bicuspidata var. bicuspidata NRRL YB-4993]